MRGTGCCSKRVADPCEFRLFYWAFDKQTGVFDVRYYCVFCRRLVTEDRVAT